MIPSTTRIAWTYVVGNTKEPSLATMTLICGASIMLSTCALALGISIAYGFTSATEQQFQAAHASLTMYTCATQLAQEPLKKLFSTVPEIEAYSFYSYATVLAQTETHKRIDQTILFKHVTPEQEVQLDSLARKLCPPENTDTFVRALNNNTVLIGSTLARDLDVCTGDTITIAYTQQEEFTSKRILFETYDVTVGGIFTTGLEHCDRELMLGSDMLYKKMFGTCSATHVDLRLRPGTDIHALKKKLGDMTHVHVTSWHDQFPAIVAALKLEQYATTIILGLILFIASMLIFALTFMHLAHRKAHIALFKAMGINNRRIGAIFLQSASIVSLTSSVIGLTVATVLAYCIDTYQLIALPEAYYVSYVPAHMSWQIPAGIICAVFALTCCAVYLPLRSTRHITIATILRQEG